ncbi:MAG TPA: signal peptidase I [Thermoanaerobaculia bacterium]|nr:signal peptidase I [Thermoanaerobaculia bacterium]
MPRQKSVLRMILQPLGVAIVLAVLVRSTVRLYAIPSGSMQPTLSVGDHIIVIPYGPAGPARGDVVVFRSPQRPSEWMVKRVVAAPGDLIDSRLGRLRIGGYTVPEPYVRRQASTESVSPQLVGANRYYVLGDDRDNSLDSRHWGSLPRQLIVGRARLVLWSNGSGRRIFKWIE